MPGMANSSRHASASIAQALVNSTACFSFTNSNFPSARAQAGLVSLGRVALDGSKVRASASRHRAMSYDRMVRAEGELAAEVRALLADAERADATEDAVHGDRRGDELPAELGSTRSARTTEYQTLVAMMTSMSGWRAASVLGAGIDESVNRRPDAVCAGTSGRLQLQDIRDADNAVPAAGLALSCQPTAGDQLVHELT